MLAQLQQIADHLLLVFVGSTGNLLLVREVAVAGHGRQHGLDAHVRVGTVQGRGGAGCRVQAEIQDVRNHLQKLEHCLSSAESGPYLHPGIHPNN